MNTGTIQYKKRRMYKYTLFTDVVYETGIIPPTPDDLGILRITAKGKLTIKKGYTWDGPSGPTFDTKTFMRGSLVHDALYQLMREEILPNSARKRADEILRNICLEDGMSKARAWWVYRAVRAGARKSSLPNLLFAPKKG